jgi:hypothetical protein
MNKYLLADFWYIEPLDRYYHVPTQEFWTAEQVNAVLPDVPVLDDDTIPGGSA